MPHIYKYVFIKVNIQTEANPSFELSSLHLHHLLPSPNTPCHDLGVFGGPGSRWLRCEKGRETQGGLGLTEGVHRGCGGSVSGVARGCGGKQRRSSRGSKLPQPTRQMLTSCCVEAARLWVALCVGHTQREGQAGECVSLCCHPPQRRPD